MVDLLLARGVSEKQIALHGHSIGGAVAAHVASFYPNIKAINDRSFGSLSAYCHCVDVCRSLVDEVVFMMHTPMKNILGIVLGVSTVC